MNLKLETAGSFHVKNETSSVTMPYICAICGDMIDATSKVIVTDGNPSGYIARICRFCSKKIALFCKDNEVAILTI